MKKVLIISYFFPPGNFAGSYRIQSWAKYLKEFGYYPIVITRHWNQNQTEYSGIANEKNVKIEQKDGYEVHYLPYSGNIRDKLSRGGKVVLIRRLLSLIEIIFQNFTNWIIPYKNIYNYSREYLQQKQDVNIIITSGKPYTLFRFGYLLNKEFNIPWVADYRDEWNTSYFKQHEKYWYRPISLLERYSEKKWVSTSEYITTVSKSCSNNISKFVNKKSYVLFNGFDDTLYSNTINKINSKEFKIIYNGTLYLQLQPINIFLDAFKNIVKYYGNEIKFKIYFIGVTTDAKSCRYIKEYLSEYEENYVLEDRIEINKLIERQKSAQLLLMTSYGGFKGIISSKLFEYLGSKRPILLCPSDKDVIEEIVTKTNAGYIGNSIEETENILHLLVKEYLSFGNTIVDSNQENILKYTRRNQTAIFAKLLDEIKSKRNFTEPKPKDRREQVFKMMFKSGLDSPLKRLYPQRNNISVITFHRISDVVDYAYPPISPAVFEGIINYISKHYDVTTFSKLNHFNKTQKPKLIITFDDGYKDFIENALPILKKYNLPAVHNVVTNSVGSGELFWTQRLNAILNYIKVHKKIFTYNSDDLNISFTNYSDKAFDQLNRQVYKKLLHLNKLQRNFHIDKIEHLFDDYKRVIFPEMMDWNDLKICVENNIEIGSHSVSHDSLNTIIDTNILIDELVNSKKMLEDQLGICVVSFAFPNGEYNDVVMEQSIKAGYRFLQTTRESFFNYNTKQDYNIVPRYQLYYNRIYENIFKIHNFHNLYR